MCLYKTHKWPKVAWKPITVYKVFRVDDDELISPCLKFEYKIGKTYLSKRSPVLGIAKETITSEGIHSYSNSPIACHKRGYDEVVAECTIPRFSLYYIGEWHEIASGRIIVRCKLYHRVLEGVG